MPALFTSTSTRPKASYDAATSPSSSSQCPTWQAMARARRPVASTWRATASQFSNFRLATMTSAPASAKASAIALPNPRLPPVTRATRPASTPAPLSLIEHPFLASAQVTRQNLPEQFGDGGGHRLGHGDVEELVGPVGVGVRAEHAGCHELGAGEAALQVGQERDGAPLAVEPDRLTEGGS